MPHGVQEAPGDEKETRFPGDVHTLFKSFHCCGAQCSDIAELLSVHLCNKGHVGALFGGTSPMAAAAAETEMPDDMTAELWFKSFT